MSKVSVKYYLNKNLKGEADRWPVYIMIIHKRNPQRIVSRLFKGQCYTEKEFASDETAQHIVKKGTEIIENTYNYICKIYGQEFDIKNYKNTGISTITGVITEPFKERFLGVDWKTDWKFENISNFFDFINKQLNINIINCIYNNETINSFFDTNRAEFEKLGIVKNEYTKQFEGVRLGEYKYNITSDKDKEIIKKQYMGGYNSNRKKNGFGIEFDINGYLYIGFFINDQKCGTGILYKNTKESFSDPDFYISKKNKYPSSRRSSEWYSEQYGADIISIPSESTLSIYITRGIFKYSNICLYFKNSVFLSIIIHISL